MKKKFVPVLCVLLILVLAATAFGPGIILACVWQETPETGYAYSDSFYTTYDDVRAHLQELTAELGSGS